MFIYRGGLGKAGQKLLQEVIRYPNEMVQSTSHQYCGPIYPCFILPTNRIHLKLGGCSPHPGRQISVVGVSELLPLVMSLSDIFSRKLYTLQCIQKKTTSSNIDIYTIGLSYTVLPLIKSVSRMDCPPTLKEKVFQCLANSLWTLSYVQSIDSSSFPVIPAKFVSSISQELEQLYEVETANFTANKTTRFPPEGLICIGGVGKFSTYFQILLELVLASQYYMRIYQTTPTSDQNTDQKKSFNSTRKDSAGTVKNKSWLKYVTRIVDLLQRVIQNRPINREFYNLFRKSLPVKAETKLLVVTGLNTGLEQDDAVMIITDICNKYGGMVSDGLYLPCVTREVPDKTSIEEETTPTTDKETTPTTDKETTPTTGEETTPAADAMDTPTTDDKITPTIDDKTMPATDDKTTPKAVEKTTPTIIKSFVCGRAVIELQNSEKSSVVSSALLSATRLLGGNADLSVSCVSSDLKCSDDTKANETLHDYLHNRLFNGKSLQHNAKSVLSSIFNMAAYDNGKISKSSLEEKNTGESYFRLLISRIIGERDMKKILGGIYEGKKGAEIVNETKFIEWIEREAKRDILCVWRGLLAAGYDFNYQRYGN